MVMSEIAVQKNDPSNSSYEQKNNAESDKASVDFRNTADRVFQGLKDLKEAGQPIVDAIDNKINELGPASTAVIGGYGTVGHVDDFVKILNNPQAIATLGITATAVVNHINDNPLGQFVNERLSKVELSSLGGFGSDTPPPVKNSDVTQSSDLEGSISGDLPDLVEDALKTGKANPSISDLGKTLFRIDFDNVEDVRDLGIRGDRDYDHNKNILDQTQEFIESKLRTLEDSGKVDINEVIQLGSLNQILREAIYKTDQYSDRENSEELDEMRSKSLGCSPDQLTFE
jgi:hypothetical protein